MKNGKPGGIAKPAEVEKSLRHEQEAYARWLAHGVRLGFGVLVVSFVVYLAQWLPSTIAPRDLPRYWHLPVREYLAATGAPTGWGWLRRLGEGDVLNFVGIAILASLTIACYLRVLPVFARARERVLLAICVAEIAVLLLAASGIVAVP